MDITSTVKCAAGVLGNETSSGSCEQLCSTLPVLNQQEEFPNETQCDCSAGILAGIKKGALSDTGAAIAMKAGCLEVLQRAVKAGIPT